MVNRNGTGFDGGFEEDCVFMVTGGERWVVFGCEGGGEGGGW